MKRLTRTLLALFAAALLTGPAASAHDATAEVHVPFAAHNWQARTWFTRADLERAQVALGYDPAEWGPHTICNTVPGTPPTAEPRFDFCEHAWLVDSGGNEDWSMFVLYRFDPDSDTVVGRLYQQSAHPPEVHP